MKIKDNPYLYLWKKLFTKNKGINKTIIFKSTNVQNEEFNFNIKLLRKINMIYIKYDHRDKDYIESLCDIIYSLKEIKFLCEKEIKIYKKLIDKKIIKPFILNEENLDNKDLFEVNSHPTFQHSKLIDLKLFIDSVCNEFIENPISSTDHNVYARYYIE